MVVRLTALDLNSSFTLYLCGARGTRASGPFYGLVELETEIVWTPLDQ